MTDLADWKQEREKLNGRIEELRAQGKCYTCYDLETGELFPRQEVIYEDGLFKIVLELYPRMKGHTIVIYKPHREDISELAPEEAGQVFQMCLRVIKALRKGLGAEKVYLNTMCDGGINHLHFQLFPRYPGDKIGSTRFVAPRSFLEDEKETAVAIRSALK